MAAAAVAGLYAYGSYLLSPVDASRAGRPRQVDIRSGSGAREIARKLKAAGLIRSPLAFTTMARFLNKSQSMKAGIYEIRPHLGVGEIIDKLVEGDAVAQWVVIPEGLTLRQIAERLETRRVADAEAFVRTAARKPKHLGLAIPVSRASVDGYLMPDTYQFYSHGGEDRIIRTMLDTWKGKVYQPHQALFKRSGLPMDQVVILASLIEREAKVPEDRARIASVIRNRLKRNMKLEIDATVLYALGGHKERVTYADLKTPSPYNTYYRKGLPPGPICNPGLASIRAALLPEKTPYLFYVARPDGRHLFAATFAQHQANIARVRQMRRAQAAPSFIAPHTLSLEPPGDPGA